MEEQQIQETATARAEPDVGLCVLALIALARQLQAETEAGPAVTND